MVVSASVVGKCELKISTEKLHQMLYGNLCTLLFSILLPSVLLPPSANPPPPPPPPKPSAQEDLLAALLTCDVIVYDVVEDQTQVDEASWAVQGERGEREEAK